MSGGNPCSFRRKIPRLNRYERIPEIRRDVMTSAPRMPFRAQEPNRRTIAHLLVTPACAMAAKTELIWDVTPADFFEAGSLPIATKNGEWTFDDGKAVLTLHEALDPVPDTELHAFRKELRALLLARSHLLDRPSSASERQAIRQTTKAGVNHILQLGSGHVSTKEGSVEVVIRRTLR